MDENTEKSPTKILLEFSRKIKRDGWYAIRFEGGRIVYANHLERAIADNDLPIWFTDEAKIAADAMFDEREKLLTAFGIPPEKIKHSFDTRSPEPVSEPVPLPAPLAALFAPPSGYNVQQAAKMLNVTSQTVRDWIRIGVLPATRKGLRKFWIEEEDLKQFVTSGKREAGAASRKGPRAKAG